MGLAGNCCRYSLVVSSVVVIEREDICLSFCGFVCGRNRFLVGCSALYRDRQLNTLRDTNEPKARPSVWPVYVVAVVVLIVGGMPLLIFGQTLLSAEGIRELSAEAAFFAVVLAAVAYGLFGVITAIGMMRLRPWAWSCGRGFFAPWIVFGGLGLLGVIVDGLFLIVSTFLPMPERAPPRRTETLDGIAFDAVCLVVALLLVKVVTTRRQLFFPPKPEGEE